MKTAEEIIKENPFPQATHCIEEWAEMIAKIYADQLKPKWIPVSEKLPESGDRVLIIIDVRKWSADRKPRIEVANVGRFNTPTKIGGPNALTGYSMIEGIYFSVPAILHPESVTHWMPLPEKPE